MRAHAAAAALALVAVLAGCGGDEQGADSDYCSALKEEKATLARLADEAGEPGKDVLTPTLKALGRLRDESPSSLRDEWDTVYYAWDSLVDAVTEAGVDPGEFRPGQTPPGISAADAKRLTEVSVRLASGRVVDATRGLEDHARQVCEVELRV